MMDNARGVSEIASQSPITCSVKMKCLTGTHNAGSSASRFPKLNECAHFHYEIVELGNIQVTLSDDKQQGQDVKSYMQQSSADDKTKFFCVSVTANGKSWVLRRSYDNFYMLDRQVHRCIYDRKYSQLPDLPISDELFEYIASSNETDMHQDGLRTMLMKYLDRFSILAGNLINCGPVLNWFELDNRGNRLLVPEESAINTPAVGAGYVIKRYSAQATDEISFEVGDMVSVIDMPPPEDSVWWRGKKGFEVGFFPCDCVEIIGEKIPKNINIPKKSPSKPVLRKRGKLITFFRSFLLTRPSRRKLKQRGILRERVFGCDLGEHLLNSGHDIPIVLKCCTEFIEEYGIVDGIYRLSGVTSNIQKLRVAFDEERVPNLHEEAIIQDIHCVASLLKMYFRELPNPLLTYQLYDKFVAAVQSTDEVRLLKMRDVVHQLPPPHYRTLEYLIKHLSRVASHGNNTGMGPKNLAIVWAPNLLRSKDLECGSVAALHVVGVQAVLTEYLIRYSDLIFNDKMPTFPSAINKDEDTQRDQGTPKKCRPKSLAISTPTKLLSLEEARSRVLTTSITGTNNQVDAKYIEVGGGPSNLPAKYHTIIELPISKRGSGKLKKSPMGWKSFFTKSRHHSGSSQKEKSKSENAHRFERHFSLNSSFQERAITETETGGFSQNKRLRTVKSAESLASTLDCSRSASEAIDESGSSITEPESFKYSPLTSSRRSSSSSLGGRFSSTNRVDDDESVFNAKFVSNNQTPIGADADDQHLHSMDLTKDRSRFFIDSHDADDVKNITIEIGADRVTETLGPDDDVRETFNDDQLQDLTKSLTCGVENVDDLKSASPKSRKLSLKQKFKQAFTSPPSVRRVVNVNEDSQSPFKRSPASFRDKIVKTFSPESLRKKQSSADDVVTHDNSGRMSPTAPPRRKHRKRANIEEDVDSSPDVCSSDDDVEGMNDDDYFVGLSETTNQNLMSPDSLLDDAVVNETVTAEVHAVEENQNPSDFDFAKSFGSKSEKSLLEEVTSELAQKAASCEHFNAFPDSSENFVNVDRQNTREICDQNVEGLNVTDKQSDTYDFRISRETSTSVDDERNNFLDVGESYYNDAEIDQRCIDTESKDEEIKTLESNCNSLYSPEVEEIDSVASESEIQDRNSPKPDHCLSSDIKVEDSDRESPHEPDAKVESLTSDRRSSPDTKVNDLKAESSVTECPSSSEDGCAEEDESNSVMCTNKDSLNIHTDVVRDESVDDSDANSKSENDQQSPHLLGTYDPTEVISHRRQTTPDVNISERVGEQRTEKFEAVSVGKSKDGSFVRVKSDSKSRIQSWTQSSPASENNFCKSSRERWSYPLPERFSVLDNSKRRFESEIGREIVRDRLMKQELRQIQALNLQNKRNNSLSPKESPNIKAIPFQLHPLKPVVPCNSVVPEPVEADVAPLKNFSDLPEAGAKTEMSDVISDDKDDVILSPVDEVKSPTARQKSMIPRMVLPSKPNCHHDVRGVKSDDGDAIELRSSNRRIGSSIRRSEPIKTFDVKSERCSEGEIMSRSLPSAKSSYLRQRNNKTSVKELLTKFESKPEKLGQQQTASNQDIKEERSSDCGTICSVEEATDESNLNEISRSNQTRYSASDVPRKKPIPRPRTRSMDKCCRSNDILENNDIIIISDKLVESKVGRELTRPNTLPIADRPPIDRRRQISESTVITNRSQFEDDVADARPDSSALSPTSSVESPSHKVVLASVTDDDDDDATARRLRINRYKEERRAQLREKIKVESDDKISSTKKSWKRRSPLTSPVQSSINRGDAKLPTSPSATPQDDKQINDESSHIIDNNGDDEKEAACDKDSVDLTSSSSSQSTSDKHFIIIEDIPVARRKPAAPSTDHRSPPRGIRDRVALFESDKRVSSTSSCRQ